MDHRNGVKVLTLDDFDLKGKTVFLRVDMNCPIDPNTMEVYLVDVDREARSSWIEICIYIWGENIMFWSMVKRWRVCGYESCR